MRRIPREWLLLIAALCSCASVACGALTVHEWSVCTFMQDEAGKEIGGINVENEPLPESLHEAEPGPFLPVTVAPDNRNPPRAHADVRMRVERAAIQFYAEPSFDAEVDVVMNLSGCWPTHYAPAATLSNESFAKENTGWLPVLRGRLEWKEIHLAGAGETSPALLDVKGEEEGALSYRVLGIQSAPLKVVRDQAEFIITGGGTKKQIEQLWLVDVLPDGRIAFRVLHPMQPELAFLIRTPVGFSSDEYSGENRKRLREALRDAAAAVGLFEGEAEEMIATWQKFSMKSAGLRLFFFAPQQRWSNSLPSLELRRTRRGGAARDDKAKTSAAPKRIEPVVTRVMLSRIEIVTPEQRSLLAGLATVDPFKPIDEDERYARYERLGQFRNALVLDEQRRRPTATLDAFIDHFHLSGFTPRTPGWRRALK